MISYLSKPIAPGVIPQQENIGLIAQVAAEKQNKYDNILGSIFAQYNNLLNLDTSANREVTEEYNGLMSEATKNLASLAKLNLENPASIPKVESVFDPILNNTLIMEAVANTANNKKVNATYDYWQTKKPDSYNSRNHQYSLLQMEENRNMSKEDYAKKKNVVTATEYVDRDKYVLDLLKGTDLEVENTVTTPSGKYYVTKGGKSISEEAIKGLFPRNSKYMEQTKIDAFFNFSNTSDKELVEDVNNNFNNAIVQYREMNTSLSLSVSQLDKDISNVKKGVDSDKVLLKYGLDPKYTSLEDAIEYLENKKEQTSTSIKENTIAENELVLQQSSFLDSNKINYSNTNYNGTSVFTISGDVKLTREQRDNLATQSLYNSDANRFAKALAKNSTTIEIKENPDWAAQRDFEYDKELAKLNAEIKLITDHAGGTSSSSSTENTNASNNLVSGGIFTNVDHVQNEESKDVMDIKKYRTIVTDLQMSKQEVKDNYIKGQTPNGVGLSPELKEKIESKYNEAKKIYSHFNTIVDLQDDTVIDVGTAKMTFSDFKNNYASEIATIDEETVIETSLKLYGDLYSQLNNYANQVYNVNKEAEQSSEQVSNRHATVLTPQLNKNGTIPLAPSFNSDLTKLSPTVKKWLSDRLYNSNLKDVPLTDKELQYLFYNGSNPTYKTSSSDSIEISNTPINGWKPNEFGIFRNKYLQSIQKLEDTPEQKEEKIKTIIDKELQKTSLIEMNPEFLVMQKTAEETKDNPINKLSTDFTKNIVSSAFQDSANPEKLKLNLTRAQNSDPLGEKDVTSVRIRQVGNDYFAYLYSNNFLLNPDKGYKLPEGLKNEYKTILPLQRTNVLLDTMERIYSYQANESAKIAPKVPSVEISARGNRWVVQIKETGLYSIGKVGEQQNQNEEVTRSQLFTLLYGGTPSYSNPLDNAILQIRNLK